MATFTATIQLYEVTEQDYKNLFSKLEKHDLKNKCHLVKSRQFVDGKSEYKWNGNVSIQEITSSILRSVSGMGLNYSFTITRRKRLTGAMVESNLRRKSRSLVLE